MNAELLKGIAVAAELTATEISKEGVRIMAEELGRYPEEAVLEALRRCRRETKGRLTLAAIIEHIDALDGRPGADEAWGLLAHDERSTCVWTEEMQVAYASASPLLAEGDRIAARMAFRETYEREVRRVQAERRPVAWSISLGWDKAGREGPICEALERGRLTRGQAAKCLPGPEVEPAANVLMLAKDIGKNALQP